VLEFAHGKVSLVAVRAFQGVPGRSPAEGLEENIPSVDTRICRHIRATALSCPRATRGQAGDEVFCLAATEESAKSCLRLKAHGRAGEEGDDRRGRQHRLRLARAIERDYAIKIIEVRQEALRDNARPGSQTAATRTAGGVTTKDSWRRRTPPTWTLFVAVTNDDENHIMSCSALPSAGCGRVLALINRRSYDRFCFQAGEIDSSGFARARATIGTLLGWRSAARPCHPGAQACRRARGGSRSRRWCTGDRDSCRCVGRKIEEIAPAKGATIAAIVRGTR